MLHVAVVTSGSFHIVQNTATIATLPRAADIQPVARGSFVVVVVVLQGSVRNFNSA